MVTFGQFLESINAPIERTELDIIADNVYKSIRLLNPEVTYFDVRQKVRDCYNRLLNN